MKFMSSIILCVCAFAPSLSFATYVKMPSEATLRENLYKEGFCDFDLKTNIVAALTNQKCDQKCELLLAVNTVQEAVAHYFAQTEVHVLFKYPSPDLMSRMVLAALFENVEYCDS